MRMKGNRRDPSENSCMEGKGGSVQFVVYMLEFPVNNYKAERVLMTEGFIGLKGVPIASSRSSVSGGRG